MTEKEADLDGLTHTLFSSVRMDKIHLAKYKENSSLRQFLTIEWFISEPSWGFKQESTIIHVNYGQNAFVLRNTRQEPFTIYAQTFN